jgi:hypothetical protein
LLAAKQANHEVIVPKAPPMIGSLSQFLRLEKLIPNQPMLSSYCHLGHPRVLQVPLLDGVLADWLVSSWADWLVSRADIEQRIWG